MTQKNPPASSRFKLISALAVLAVFGALVEYTASVLYQPAKDLYPGFDSEIAAMNCEIFVEDSTYIRKLAAGIERVHPKTGNKFRTNSRGFRGAEFADRKAPGVLRVVCLGDSLLFGMGLPEGGTIPELLKKKLEAATGKIVEAVNLAIPGYSSLQGLRLAQEYLPTLNPDLVIVGFGYTDGLLSECSDEDYLATLSWEHGAFLHLDPILGWSKFYQLIRNKFRPERMQKAVASPRGALEGEAPSPYTARVPPEELRANLRGIAKTAAEAGAPCILLDSNLTNYYSEAALVEVAAELPRLRFLSARGALEKEAPSGSYHLEEGKRFQRFMAIQMRGLPEDGGGENSFFLLEVPLGETRYPPLPDRPQFNDEGKAGDLQAGDGVYTATVLDLGLRDFEFAPCTRIVMQQPLSSKLFLDSDFFYRLPDPDLLEEKGLYYSPVFEFRKPSFHEYLMDFNATLPNEAGAKCIAGALAGPAIELLGFPPLVEMGCQDRPADG